MRKESATRGKSLAINTLILSIGTFLPKIVSFITLPILTGCLSKAEYGTYDLILVLASLFLPAATLQIQMGAFRYLIDAREDEDATRTIVASAIAFVVPVSAIALVLLSFLMTDYDIVLRLLVCLYFLLDVFVQTAKQCVRGFGDNIRYAVAAIISAVVQLVLVPLLVLGYEFTLYGALVALIAAEAISTLFLFTKTKIARYLDMRYVSVAAIKKMLSYSWPMVPNTMAMWAMRMSNRLVITFFMGVTANAAFAVAYKIPQILTIAQSAFNMAWQENASLAASDEDAPMYYTEMFKTIYGLICGITGLLIAALPILFAILVRGGYSDAYAQMPLLVMSMFFYCISTFLGGIYVAFFKSKSVGLSTVVAAIINLALDILLIPYWGLYAASFAMIVSCFILAIYRMVGVKRIVELEYDIIPILVTCAVLFVQCWMCMQQTVTLMCLNWMVGIVLFVVMNRELVRIVFKRIKRRAN